MTNYFKVIIIPLLMLIVAVNGYGQIKEFEIKDLEQEKVIPIFPNHPEKAALIFYCPFELEFTSNMGGIIEKKQQQDNKCILIIEPIIQVITIKSLGYKEKKFKIPKLNAKDVLYYSVETLSGFLEISTTPESGAEIIVRDADTKQIIIKGESPIEEKINAGSYLIEVSKKGYVNQSIGKEFLFSTEKNEKLPIHMEKEKYQLSIYGTSGASVNIDNKFVGRIPVENEVEAGTHFIFVEKQGYLGASKEIKIENNQTISFDLKKTFDNASYFEVRGDYVYFNKNLDDIDAQIRDNAFGIELTFLMRKFRILSSYEMHNYQYKITSLYDYSDDSWSESDKRNTIYTSLSWLSNYQNLTLLMGIKYSSETSPDAEQAAEIGTSGEYSTATGIGPRFDIAFGDLKRNYLLLMYQVDKFSDFTVGTLGMKASMAFPGNSGNAWLASVSWESSYQKEYMKIFEYNFFRLYVGYQFGL